MTAKTANLPAYLADAQAKAVNLSGLIKSLAHLDNEGACAEGRTALLNLAEPLAEELADFLDSAALPDEGPRKLAGAGKIASRNGGPDVDLHSEIGAIAAHLRALDALIVECSAPGTADAALISLGLIERVQRLEAALGC